MSQTNSTPPEILTRLQAAWRTPPKATANSADASPLVGQPGQRSNECRDADSPGEGQAEADVRRQAAKEEAMRRSALRDAALRESHDQQGPPNGPECL
jgi:hypothetical protein